MCYSVMLVTRYQQYLRETGAEMDVDQFEEIFGMRAADPGVRILRGVERWFDRPESPAAQRVHALITAFNHAQVTRLEQTLFAQRKRLVDAQRQLAIKPTRKAAEDQRIATAKMEQALLTLPLYQGDQPGALDGRLFALRYAPVIVNENGRNRLRLARYHLRRPGDAAGVDQQRKGLYNARRDNLQGYWRGQYGHTHAIALMDSFFEYVVRDGRSVELHFRPASGSTMLVACLHADWRGADGAHVPSFAVITDDPPPEVAAAGHDRCPINLTPEAAQRWLTPAGRSHQELQAILDERQKPYYENAVMAA
jgi:putative SOS response-associated peptidase YedK